MTKHALALCLALFATPLWALSCMAPDAVFLFQDIRKSDDRFYFVKGTVTLTEPANMPQASDTKNTEAFTKARVSGQAMTATGFNARFDQPVTIRATCLGPWCGSPEGLSEDPHFLAIKIDGDDLTLMRGPCGGAVERWSPEDEDRVLDCHLNGNCALRGFE